MANLFYKNIDCVKGMKRYPDKFFDLAIVDPPYGNGNKKLTQYLAWIIKYKNTVKRDISPKAKYWNELFRVSKNQVIWGANHFGDVLPISSSFIIWDKREYLPTEADCELAWTSFDTIAEMVKIPKELIEDEKRIHVYQKPIALYKWILKNYAKEGDKILDTHVGSGSSIIACLDMGFDVWGFEIDEEYYKKSIERIENHLAQTKLQFIS